MLPALHSRLAGLTWTTASRLLCGYEGLGDSKSCPYGGHRKLAACWEVGLKPRMAAVALTPKDKHAGGEQKSCLHLPGHWLPWCGSLLLACDRHGCTPGSACGWGPGFRPECCYHPQGTGVSGLCPLGPSHEKASESQLPLTAPSPSSDSRLWSRCTTANRERESGARAREGDGA